MIPFVKRFFTNEALFERVARAVLYGSATAIVIHPEVLAAIPPVAAVPIAALAGLIYAGDRNVETPEKKDDAGQK